MICSCIVIIKFVYNFLCYCYNCHHLSLQLGRRAMALFFLPSLHHPLLVIRSTSAALLTQSQKLTDHARVRGFVAPQIGSTFRLRVSCRKMLPKHYQVLRSFSQNLDLEG